MSRNSGAKKKQASVSDMVRSLDQPSAASGKRPRVWDAQQPSPTQSQGREDVRALRTMFREETESLRRQTEESLTSLREMIEEKVNGQVSLIETKWQRFEERLNELERHVEMKDAENAELHDSVKDRDAKIDSMSTKLDDLEARFRRNTLVFSGPAVPRPPGRSAGRSRPAAGERRTEPGGRHTGPG